MWLDWGGIFLNFIILTLYGYLPFLVQGYYLLGYQILVHYETDVKVEYEAYVRSFSQALNQDDNQFLCWSLDSFPYLLNRGLTNDR